MEKGESQNAHKPRTSPTLRVIITLYVLSYILLMFISFLIAASISQSDKTIPDTQTSYVTCANGTKYSYAQLGIYNPADDAFNTQTNAIDTACGGSNNTYTNIYSGRTPSWWYGFVAFGIGMFLIEMVKSGLVYITQGYVPNWGSVSKKLGEK